MTHRRDALPDYWLNRLLYDTQSPAEMAAYLGDRTAYLGRYALRPEVRSALERDDVAALYELGSNPYLLRFYCRGVGMTEGNYLRELHAMAGEPASAAS